MSKKELSYFFEPHNDIYPLYQWEPKHQNNRIIAQQSVFVFGSAEVELALADKCVVVESCKENILKSLEKSLGITEASMFPDFYGFANLHSQRKRYVEPDAHGYLRRGRERHLEGNLGDAIVYYTEVISLDPDRFIAANAYYNRGLAYGRKGELDKAIQDFSKVIDWNDNYAAAYYNRGLAYGRKGELDKAIQDFSKAIDLKPAYAEAYNYRGNAYAQKADSDRAIQDYNKAIELSPEYAAVYYNRGLAFLRLQQWENARADLTTAREKGIDITAAFHNIYKSVADFEAKHSGPVPEDIAALLSGD